MITEDKMELLWGVDLGGTKIELAVLDKQNPKNVLFRERLPTESAKGYEHILGQIKKLVDQATEFFQQKPQRVGFATPGVLNPATQTMKNSNTQCLNGKALAKDLEEILACPVKLANDANCFALAEALLGAAPQVNPKAEIVFGIIMGTGVGGGLVAHNKIINGLHGIGGEWGHNILEEGGVDCYCGKSGCVEQVISGPALQDYYQKISGQEKNMKEIVEAYRNQSDEFAMATMERLFEYFGRAISTLINVMDPDVIVIGGGVGNIDELYTIGYERIKKYIFNSGEVLTPIVKPTLGDSAGVFGAAVLGYEL